MRISTITTRQGDDGKTLLNGRKIPKNHPQIVALGEIDELNAFIGLLRSECDAVILEKIQHALFSLGRDVALPDAAPIFSADFVAVLEEEMESLRKNQKALKEFMLPCGNKAAALAQVCRAVCRRAERALVAFNRPNVFLNRLSDYFFVLARHLNKESESLWNKDFLQ